VAADEQLELIVGQMLRSEVRLWSGEGTPGVGWGWGGGGGGQACSGPMASLAASLSSRCPLAASLSSRCPAAASLSSRCPAAAACPPARSRAGCCVQEVENAATWQPIVSRLARQSALTLSPRVAAALGDHDPRSYIKVRCGACATFAAHMPARTRVRHAAEVGTYRHACCAWAQVQDRGFASVGCSRSILGLPGVDRLARQLCGMGGGAA
jgi:hypothetical protein